MENLQISREGEIEIARSNSGRPLHRQPQSHLHLHRTRWHTRLGARLWWFHEPLRHRRRLRQARNDDVYNNFYSTHSGLVVGIDTSLTDNIQLGFFGNYGNINLTQFAGSDTGGGSWNPNGYGGGVMASYWDDNFYVQGAFGATAFSGDNKRQVKVGTIVNETYTATKNTTSYMGTVRVGAPFTWGGVILEPQATAIWNGNEDASYTESGKYRAFALKLNSYSDNFLRTALGAMLAWPIKQGERKLIVPNIKVAWLADWDTNNGAVKFKRAHTRTA